MFGLSTIKLVLLGVGATILLGMAGTIWFLRHENGALHERVATVTGERDAAVRVNAENVVELAAIRLDAQRAVTALAAENAEMQARARRSATIKQEIARVPPSDVRPVGPAMLGMLRGLRAAGPAGDQDRARPAGGPAAAPDVRP